MKLRSFITSLMLILPISCNQPESSTVKIIGGKAADQAYSFFVTLTDESGESILCGASLIQAGVALTAAHCLYNEKGPFYLGFGLQEKSGEGVTQVRSVHAVELHPSYDDKAFVHDIALLFFDVKQGDELLFPSGIELNHDPLFPKAGENARVVGFGNKTTYGVWVDRELHQVDVPIIENESCKNLGGLYAPLTESQICAGDMKTGGKDSCRGDSGGPLFSSSEKARLLGIVSYGDNCGQKDKPGVYTRVSSYIDWIQATIADVKNPRGPLTLQTAEQHFKRYCHQQVVGGSVLLETNPFRFLANVTRAMGVPHSWRPLDVHPSLEAALQAEGLSEIGRCEAKVSEGNSFTLLYALNKNIYNKLEPAAAFLNLNGRLYRAESIPEVREFSFDCLQPNDIVNVIFKENGNKIYVPGRLPGLMVAKPQNELISQSTCGGLGYKADIFEDQDKQTYVRVQTGIDQEPIWFQLAANVNPEEPEPEEPNELDLEFTIKPINRVKGFLQIRNHLEIDIFSWQIACPFAFTLKDNDGITLASESRPEDGYQFVNVMHPSSRYGSIPQGQSIGLVMEIKKKTLQAALQNQCRFNQMDFSITMEKR